MTGAEIRLRVLRKFKIPSTSTVFDTDILDYINMALDIISSKGTITLVEQSVALTASTRKYALTTGVTRVNECFIDTLPQGLTRIPPEEVYRYAETLDTGTPWGFWEDNGFLFVHPMPSSSMTLYAMVSGAIPHLSALSDNIYQSGTTLLAPAYTTAIAFFVVYQIGITEKDDFQALTADAQASWSALLDIAVNLDKSRIARRFGGPVPRRIVGRRGPRFGNPPGWQ